MTIINVHPTTTNISTASILSGLIVYIMKTHEWTPKRWSRALGLIQGGRHSLSEISHITNIPKGSLGNLKKRNIPLNKPWSGHPHKLSIRDKRQIVLHITRNHESRRLSTMSIIQQLQLDIGITQLKLTLQDLGYHHRIARCQPFLKKLDRKRRLQFAKRHAHFTVEDWKAFIWTDEMSVKVGMQRSTRDWVWRKNDEELHPDYIDYRKRATGTGMMFWGAFRWGRIGPGVFFKLEKGRRLTLLFIEITSWQDHFRSSGRNHLKSWTCQLWWKIMPLPTRRYPFLSDKSWEWCTTNTLQILLILIQLRTFGRI